MTLPDLYVLRHGETDWNRAGRWQGHADSPLTPEGIAQAEAQGRLLTELPVSEADLTVWTSPQGRAARTAEIALRVAGWRQTARMDERLMEIDVGAWTGHRRDDLRAAANLPSDANMLALYELAPGGEGVAALRARVTAFLADLSRPAVIVTHGITSRVLRAVALGLPSAEAGCLPGGQGVIHRIAQGSHATLAPPDAAP